MLEHYEETVKYRVLKNFEETKNLLDTVPDKNDVVILGVFSHPVSFQLMTKFIVKRKNGIHEYYVAYIEFPFIPTSEEK